MHDMKHLSKATANNRLATIKSYVKYVCAKDMRIQQYAFAINQVPFYTLPQKQQGIIENVDAISAILSMPPNTKKGLRDKVIMSVLFDSGMRVDELLSLKIRNIEIKDDEAHVSIHGKGDKYRPDILDKKTTTLIKQYLNEYHSTTNMNDPFIYTNVKGVKSAMSARNVQKMIKRYADLARNEGYDVPDGVSPHMLRRTRGTLLYRDGVPLEDIAVKFGHASTDTTKKHYTSPF